MDLFWSMLWFFLFFAWIWLLITIFADIFRSDDQVAGERHSGRSSSWSCPGSGCWYA